MVGIRMAAPFGGRGGGQMAWQTRQAVRPAVCLLADCHPERRTERPSTSQPSVGVDDQWSEWPSAIPSTKADRWVEWLSIGGWSSWTSGRPLDAIFPKDSQSDKSATGTGIKGDYKEYPTYYLQSCKHPRNTHNTISYIPVVFLGSHCLSRILSSCYATFVMLDFLQKAHVS
jgi:hypothetical protein